MYDKTIGAMLDALTLQDIRSAICLLAFFFLGNVRIYTSTKTQKYADVPLVGITNRNEFSRARQHFRRNAQEVLLEGYNKYKGRPFYVPSPLGERMMIPPHYVEELKNARDDEVDFVGTFFEMFEGRYTTMGSRATLHPRVARSQLNQNIHLVLEPLNDEIKSAFTDLLPASNDWTPTAMSDKILMIVARASSRMFGGLELSRNDAWLKATLDFASDGFYGAQKIKQYPRFLRPLASYFIPELWRIRKHYRTTRTAIVPMLKSRKNLDLKEKPSDFLQWMMDDAKGPETELDFIADIQLKMSFAAIHTSAATPLQLIYDLCAMPEYVSPLREEIERVVDRSGQINKQTLMQLPMLDSFMKESQRFNPLLLETFERIITKDFRFSDGFVIPSGTQVGVPAQAIAMDPEIFEDPTVFDGFRFSKIASSSDTRSNGRLQWSASNHSSMAFGYGKHACPGRAFAGFEIKLIMIYFLMNFDFKFEDTIKNRPPNLMVETQMIPDHQTQILLRRREPTP